MDSVTLNDNDVRLAATVAFNRGFESVLAGLPNKNGGDRDPFYRHVIGALGECAFAKAANIFWDGSLNRFTGMGGDVGKYQVRTRSGRLPLIIRPNDSDTDIFILVYRTNGVTQWTVAGWVLGGEGKHIGRIEHMQGGPRFMVDIEKLHPMAELK